MYGPKTILLNVTSIYLAIEALTMTDDLEDVWSLAPHLSTIVQEIKSFPPSLFFALFKQIGTREL